LKRGQNSSLSLRNSWIYRSAAGRNQKAKPLQHSVAEQQPKNLTTDDTDETDERRSISLKESATQEDVGEQEALVCN